MEVDSPPNPKSVELNSNVTATTNYRLPLLAMTSRLKHKLELENVNLKSAYINESFVQVS